MEGAAETCSNVQPYKTDTAMESKVPEKFNGAGPKHLKSPKTTPMLSPENWEKIIDGLPPKDFHAVITACPEWRELMGPKIGTTFLPQVFDLLWDFLPLNDILSCRVVNRKTKSTVDTLLQHYSTQNELNHPPRFEVKRYKNRILTLNSRCYDFTTNTITKTFLTHFKDPQTYINPFLTGTAKIAIGCRASNGQFVLGGEIKANSSTEMLLSAHGHQISNLRVDFSIFLLGQDGQFLFSTLDQVPNVKSLEFSGRVACHSIIFWFGLIQNLPELPQLRFVDVSDLTPSIDFASPFVLKYGLCSLIVEGFHEESTEKVNEFQILANKLSAGTHHIKADERHIAGMYQRIIREQRSGGWQIKNLQLIKVHNQPSKICQIVNLWSTALETLNLFVELERREPKGRVAGFWKPLPVLRILGTFFVNMERNWFWNFIIDYCPKLEELHLYSVNKEMQQKAKREVGRVAERAWRTLPNVVMVVLHLDTGKLVISKPTE